MLRRVALATRSDSSLSRCPVTASSALERSVDARTEDRGRGLLRLYQGGWQSVASTSEGGSGNQRPCPRLRRLPQQRHGAHGIGVVAEDVMDLDGVNAGLQFDVGADLVD